MKTTRRDPELVARVKIVNPCKCRRVATCRKNLLRGHGGLTIEKHRENRHFAPPKTGLRARRDVRLSPAKPAVDAGGWGGKRPHRGISIEGDMNLSDLSPPARLYLLGYTKNNRARAGALAEVVFTRASLRTVAKAYGIPPRTLRRQRDAFRRKFKTMMRSAKVSVFDLVARSEQG